LDAVGYALCESRRSDVIFRLAHPVALIFLLIPVIMWFFSRQRNRVSGAMRYSDTRLMTGIPQGWRVRLRRTPDILRIATWCLLVITLARPQTGQSQVIVRGEGIEIVLALDISGSMSAEDFGSPNRLEAAKDVIAEFVQARTYDRIGLVVFAREAFHQVPPTLDYNILVRLLDEVQLASDLGLEEGTAIGLGIASAANMLRHSAAASRIIILLTDGAHNAEGIAPLDAAHDMAMLGIRVYTIGIGSNQSNQVILADNNIQFVQNGLDEATLREIAAIADGQYFRATDLQDLRAVYDQINRLERSDIEFQQFVRWQDQIAAFLLGFSLILFVLERLLRYTVFRSIP
jgi:Ca-activated chloride channel homolog